ncbi:MAG: hypothetical protein P1P88_11645 [Bacteroidales bacterium]|nr:hypothetical protein [Bacteroidales bacterium]
MITKLKNLLNSFDKTNRARAAEAHEWEEKELRNVFALLVCGSFLGHPSPPMHITNELLPVMEEDLEIMFEQLDLSRNPLSELFSRLEVG